MSTFVNLENWDWFEQNLLGAGEFVKLGPGSTVHDATRKTFMRAIVFRAPEILVEAAETLVGPFDALEKSLVNRFGDDHFLHLDERQLDPHHHPHEGRFGPEFSLKYLPAEFHPSKGAKLWTDHFESAWAELNPALEDVREALGQWMGKHRLPYLWILSGLRHSLRYWWKQSRSDPSMKPIEAFSSFFGSPGCAQGHPLLPEEMNLRIDIERAYDPLFYERSACEERCRKEAAEAITSYFGSIDERMLDAGYVRAKKKRTKLHYLMAVDRNVKCKSWKDIAAEFGCSEKAAIDGVQELEQIMRIVPYKGKPGRPAKVD